MDGLLLALIACMAGEMGGRSQLLSLALATRHRNRLWVAISLALAAAVNAAIAAYAGSLLVGLMNDGAARHLFMALAFLASGASLWLPTRAPDRLTGWRRGALGTSFLGLFILGLGGSAPFLIAGITVARGHPLLTATGGATGIIAACLPALLAGQAFVDRLPLQLLCRIMGSLFLLAGGTIAIYALGLA